VLEEKTEDLGSNKSSKKGGQVRVVGKQSFEIQGEGGRAFKAVGKKEGRKGKKCAFK